MQPKAAKKVLAIMSDLMFTVKVQDAAKRVNLPVTFVKTDHDALEQARTKPDLIILDLNCVTVNPVELIQTLKADPESKGIYMISFISHVQGELKQAAQSAGCDMVLARSAFSQGIVQILQRYSGVIN
jgi:CheY-like chemotaxis protein